MIKFLLGFIAGGVFVRLRDKYVIRVEERFIVKRLEHSLLIVSSCLLVMAFITAVLWFREGHIPMPLLGFVLVIMVFFRIVELCFIEDACDA